VEVVRSADVEPAAALRSLEAKAQAELETWQKMQSTRKVATPGFIERREQDSALKKVDEAQDKSGSTADGPKSASSGDQQKPKERFRARPWISLK